MFISRNLNATYCYAMLCFNDLTTGTDKDVVVSSSCSSRSTILKIVSNPVRNCARVCVPYLDLALILFGTATAVASYRS
jgi:hypothetical protein